MKQSTKSKHKLLEPHQLGVHVMDASVHTDGVNMSAAANHVLIRAPIAAVIYETAGEAQRK